MKKYVVVPGKKVVLGKNDPEGKSGLAWHKKPALKETEKLKARLEALQEKLYASHDRKVLIVLQGMDSAGKDSTIRLVFEGVNPQGVRVINFRQPSKEELDHDFLWRVHGKVPGSGEIVIFNRSHYESVLVVRVHQLVPAEIWKHRYQEINDFERMLCEEGTVILKFFLNISREEQKKRLEDRLKDPTKEWKFSANDLPEREYWPEYMKAYEEVFEKTSTEWAPWYIVPSNHKWVRDLIIATAIVDRLEALDLKYPKLDRKSRAESIK